MLCAIAGMGGAEFSLLELVKHLRDSYEFHLIIPGEGPFQRHARSGGRERYGSCLGRKLFSAPAKPPCMPERGRFCAPPPACGRSPGVFPACWKKFEPSVFITNAVKAHLIGALARKPQHVPLIWYMRDGLEERILSRKLLALLSRRCDMSVCISHYVAAQFREYVSASLPSTVIYNIVDLNRFHPGVAPPADLSQGPGRGLVWHSRRHHAAEGSRRFSPGGGESAEAIAPRRFL